MHFAVGVIDCVDLIGTAIVPPQNETDLWDHLLHDHFAMVDDKIASQLTFGVWTYAALPDNIKTIKSVIRRTIKTAESGRIIRLKSRAYAKGFGEREGRDFAFYGSSSPVVSSSTGIKLLMAIAALRKMELRAIGIKCAYLQSSFDDAAGSRTRL